MLTTENRRQYFRHQFGTNLCAQIRIASIGTQIIDSKKTYVCVRDIGAGGIRFESHLNLPKREDVILEATMTLGGKEVVVNGYIIRIQPLSNGYFEYGMKFTISSEDQLLLLKIVNDVSVKTRNSMKPTGCSMCTSHTACHKNITAKRNSGKWSRS